MDQTAGWRTDGRQPRRARIAGGSPAGGGAYPVASRAFGTDVGDAVLGGVSGAADLSAVQRWAALRHGPDAAGDTAQEDKREYRCTPSGFGSE